MFCKTSQVGRHTAPFLKPGSEAQALFLTQHLAEEKQRREDGAQPSQAVILAHLHLQQLQARDLQMRHPIGNSQRIVKLFYLEHFQKFRIRFLSLFK